MIIPEWWFQDPIENKTETIYNLKSFKQIARKNPEKQEKKLAKKIINPDYFTNRTLHLRFNIY